MAATADERNFRSSYYEKVGFRNVEEKKSLEILLKEKSLDKTKLNHFCLRFPVPGIHRSYLWKLLLGVLPLQVVCHDYVWSCREQSFNDLARQMKVLKLDTQSAPQNVVIMWLLETDQVPTGCKDPLTRKPIYENLAKVAAMMMEFFDNDIEVFWVSKAFFNFLSRLAIEMPKLSECTNSLLEKEDPDLYNYMMDKELLSNLPYFDWYTSMFAIVLNESSLCKIWDKMVGGSYKILIFVGVSLCLTLKNRIMASDTLDNLLNIFENVTEEASELVVNKAIDLWQQHSNSINIGLEFSIKHNPTALWAAQQVHSMPNLNSGPIIGGTTNSDVQGRPATVPSSILHICSSASGCSSTDEWDVSRPDGEIPRMPSLNFHRFYHRAASDDGYFQPNVLLQHMDEMTRALSELDRSQDVLERTGHDEVWMLPSNTPIEKKTVTIAEKPTSVIIKEEECIKANIAAQVENGIVEQEELVSSNRNICITLLFLLLTNCTFGLAIILFWAIYFI